MKNFLQSRIDLVKDLYCNNDKIHYADLVLILTAVISSCAAK